MHSSVAVYRNRLLQIVCFKSSVSEVKIMSLAFIDAVYSPLISGFNIMNSQFLVESLLFRYLLCAFRYNYAEYIEVQ